MGMVAEIYNIVTGFPHSGQNRRASPDCVICDIHTVWIIGCERIATGNR